jgi:microcystin-dependent protein
MQQTPNLGLNKPEGTDVVDIEDLNVNADILDAKLGASGHSHNGTAGNGPKITATGLADEAATDAVIGYRTITDTAAPTSNTGSLTTLLGCLANMVKSITGKSTWRTFPAINLQTIYNLFGISGHSHNGTAGQGPKIAYTNITGTPTSLPANGGTSASCSGNAATATKLATARTIALTGVVTGSGSFDGSGNLNINTSGGVPPSAVNWFARLTPPSGWLECNGAAVSRTTYSALFAAIGTAFGAGNGSTTFNLPDLRSEFIRGWDHGRGIDVDRVFGSYQGDALKSHNHTITGKYMGNGTHGVTGPNGNEGDWNKTDNSTDYTGDIETRPRNVALMPCIKY